MNKLLNLEEARALNEPCHKAWMSGHRDTVKNLNKWREAIPELFVPLKEVELCSIVHRHVYARVSGLQNGSIISTDKLGFNAQIVEGQALVRFKHLDGDLAASAYQTNQQQHLERQEYTDEMWEQLIEEGLDAPPTMLTCGYRMSPTWDELLQVAVVCRYRGRYLWHYDLHNEAGETWGEVQQLPGTPPIAPRIISTKPKQITAADESE